MIHFSVARKGNCIFIGYQIKKTIVPCVLLIQPIFMKGKFHNVIINWRLGLAIGKREQKRVKNYHCAHNNDVRYCSGKRERERMKTEA